MSRGEDYNEIARDPKFQERPPGTRAERTGTEKIANAEAHGESQPERSTGC